MKEALAIKLDPYNFRPLYYQLAEHLDRLIVSGELKPETQLPPEDELCLQYEISRNTLRNCLKKLESEGKIYRVKGRGTFVAPNVAKLKNLVILVPDDPHKHESIKGLLVGALMCTQEADALIQVVAQNRYADTLEAARHSATRQTGVVLIRRNPNNAQNAALAEKYGFPVLAEGVSDFTACSTIDTDSEDAIRKSVHHLYGLGHRRFGWIGINNDIPGHHYRRRDQGLRKALGELGLSLAPEDGLFFRESGDIASVFLVKDEGKILDAWLDRPGLPTAIMTVTDNVASMLYRAAQRRGLRIPGDISVVGFDDVSYAPHMNPPLTTVRLDYCRLGFLAAQHVLRMMTEYQTRPFHFAEKLELIVRESTAKPKRGGP